jgi:membrane fusion protein (multidrug efflux system)
MSNSFQRVNQSLRADRGLTSTIGLSAAIILLSAWVFWAFAARITRYEISDSARLEVDSADYAVEASSSGRLIVSHLALGKEVHAGDVLAELDNTSERLSLQEERTRLAALAPQLVALQSEVQTENDGRTDERKVLTLSTNGAQAQYNDANAQAVLAEEEWNRANRLRAEGIMSEADAQRANAVAQSKRAVADSLKAALSRLEPELQVRERDREIKTKETLSNIAKLEAEIATASATVHRLEYEIERQRIRASVTGRLGECATLRPGSYINEGQKLGVILPSGKLQVVAEFQPSAALGKVRPGQPAILRLQGFPWAQYGVVAIRVSRVASEIRDGKVRVELAVNSGFPSRIPPQHGLPGSVEVEIERVSPATLLLRSAGELAGAH